MIVVIRDEDGNDVSVKYELDEEFNEVDVKIYQATEWLTQKLIEDMLEIFEHIDEDECEDEEDIEEAVATIYDIAKLYGIIWISDLVIEWQEKTISREDLLHKLHENT